jgi:hypothetical protein
LQLDAGYVVSVSKLSSGGDIAILGEEEVGSIAAAHEFMERIAVACSHPAHDISKMYNIHGKITTKPPRGRA